jgi:hypothetical protein
MGGFDSLPAEIVVKILKYLDAHDLLQCQMVGYRIYLEYRGTEQRYCFPINFGKVCKGLKGWIDRSSALQYSIRLAMCAYKDGPPATGGAFSTSAARLEALQEHLTRWKYMDWAEQRIEIPEADEPCSAALVGGVYAVSEGTTITCFELPSRIRQIPLRTWTHVNTFNARSLTIDPSQDLLVLMEM